VGRAWRLAPFYNDCLSAARHRDPAQSVGEVMLAADYSPAAMHQANRRDLRLLLRRLAFTEPDARRALGFFRRVAHKLAAPRKPPRAAD
jgi:hypothetical protein